ncbi:hypothetical protein AGMMS50268_21220 [Spirochaetia bacterium]|nr:hypothetical protein AGMMS50268_21220 [Spirochaetia bacterium]
MKFPWKRGEIAKNEDEMYQALRRVFLSPDGLTVLRLLLNDWSFFEICDTEQKKALNEYAKKFLHDYLGMSRITVYTEFNIEDKE